MLGRRHVSEVTIPLVRLDVWLDIACLFRTRSEASNACKGGKVDLNGHSAKPNRELKSGDEIQITRPLGRRQKVVVRGFAEQHIPKPKPASSTRTSRRPLRRKKPRCCGWPGSPVPTSERRRPAHPTNESAVNYAA